VGIFSKMSNWSSDRKDKKVAKSISTLKNPKAIKDDRWMAIMFFEELENAAVAVPALLNRFDYSIEHGIQDTREKEATLEAVLSYGEDALEHIQTKLTTTTRIAWPIKALNKLGSDEQVIEVLKESLDFGDIAFDQSKVDKNYDILCYLREYKIPNFAEKVAGLLKDHDERVRLAAVEVILEQDEEIIPGLVEHLLSDTSSENTRIRSAVIGAYLAKKWPVKDKEKFNGGLVAEGVFVSKNGHLESRA